MAKYPFNVRAPANELHTTPGVSQHSLLSTGKFADANYITVFDKEMVNVYDANDTIFTVSRGAILCGFCNPVLNLYQIPLVDKVRNNNTDTIIVDRPPTEYLPDQPPPSKAVYNVYKLKTQSELVQYHHACRIPHQTHMACCHKKQPLHIVAWVDSQRGKKALPQL
jgi:hypothetical protein